MKLEELQQRISPVGDKALIDLVNGIQVNKDLIRYRKNRSFFGQLFDNLNTKSLIETALIEYIQTKVL